MIHDFEFNTQVYSIITAAGITNLGLGDKAPFARNINK